MGKAFNFTDEQKQYIFTNYLNYTYQQFADMFGCTKRQIALLLNRNGYYKGKGWTNHGKFSKEDDKYIRENYDSMDYSDIGQFLGFTGQQVGARARYLGLHKNRKLNADYFSYIDSPLKAYFLGFIFADGWIVYNPEHHNYEFGMELQVGDEYILKKINEVLGNQNIINYKLPKVVDIYGQPCHIGHIASLRVYSKRIVEDLMSHGISTNKSSKDKYPIVDDKYFFDFLRGYIDGDGCFYKDNKWTYMHITCASIKPLEYIQHKLSEYDIETKIYTENMKKHRLMCINTSEMKKLVNCLYYEDDLFCLSRKYERVKHLLGSAA